MSCDIAFDAALSSKVAYECMFSRAATYLFAVKCTAYTDPIYLVTTYFSRSKVWWPAYTTPRAEVEES